MGAETVNHTNKWLVKLMLDGRWIVRKSRFDYYLIKLSCYNNVVPQLLDTVKEEVHSKSNLQIVVQQIQSSSSTSPQLKS